MWQEEIRSTHTHAHTRMHTPTYKHRGTHTPQEIIWTPARDGNGGSRKEIIVAVSQVLCTGRPWLLCWLHRGGVRAWGALVCSLLSSALGFIWSTLPFLLNAQSPLRNKNRHTLHSIFRPEQSLLTERNSYCEKGSEETLFFFFVATKMFKYSL